MPSKSEKLEIARKAVEKLLGQKTKISSETNTEEFVQRFQEKYAGNRKTEPVEPDNHDITTISLKIYQQPEITDEVKNKIDRLKNITDSIEKNLIKPDRTKRDENKFKIDYRKSLNQAQYLAVTTLDGPLLVIAGAGSGKTRTIVYRVAFLLEKGIPPQKILLLTFTRKASQEMLNRVTSLLNDSQCQRVMGGTFHSTANYLLRKYSKIINISPNFTIIDTVDAEDIIDLVRHELNLEKKQQAFPRKKRIQGIISKSKNHNVGIDSIIKREFSGLTDFIEDIELIGMAYSVYKKAANLFDYDDLMEMLRDALRDNLHFRKRVQDSFNYVMVDEFQDTNIIQKEIVDLVAEKHRNIMVVGDDSQSIYSFRGANLENILRFPETYPDCKLVKIEENYRSSQSILSFTNSIIDNARIGYRKKLFSTSKPLYKPTVHRCYGAEEEAAYIVSKILQLRERDIPINQMAVIYRASYHGNYIQMELLTQNIPYVVFGGIRFIERRHIKDMIAYLRIMLNPLDAASWNRILKLIPGIGKVTASKVMQHIQKSHGKIAFNSFSGKNYSSYLEKLALVLNKVSHENVALVQKIEVLRDYYKPLLKNMETDYEKRLLDIDVLLTLARKYKKLEKFLSDFALDPPSNKFQDQTTPLIDESEEKPLVLTTVHSSKGLEWNSVFIPHLLDGLFPSIKAIGNIEDLEEERRLFYVASTRAKEQLYLTVPSFIPSWDSHFTLPSRFLIEIAKGHYELSM